MPIGHKGHRTRSKTQKGVQKAVMLVAGYGTRFLPATKAVPKEMLPIVDKPVIQYLVEEAVSAGIRDIILVTSRAKRAIEEHFDRSPELEDILRQKGKHELYREVQRVATLGRFISVRQDEPLGTGHALLQARSLIGPDEPFAVFYGDDVIDARVPCMRQMLRVFERIGKPVIAIEQVPWKEVSKYGVIAGKKVEERLYRLETIVEKPSQEEAPSNLTSVGEFILTPDIFPYLARLRPAKGREIYLIDALANYLRDGNEVYGYQFQGTRFDCGDKMGLLRAWVHFGLKHPALHRGLRSYLKQLKI